MYRTANLQSCILYIYSTNIGTKYFKRGIYSPFFFFSKCSLFHNSNLFGSCVIYILYTGCAKIKKKYSRRQKVKPYRIQTVQQLSDEDHTRRVITVHSYKT